MKITLLTTGTLGDVRPYLALALGLREAGHEVALAAPENFESYVLSHRIDYRPLIGNTRKLLESEQGQAWMTSVRPRAFIKQVSKVMHAIRHDLHRDLAAACRDGDALICHPLMLFEAAVLSEKLHKPLLYVFPSPLVPATSKFPQFLVANRRLPLGILNRLTYSLFAKIHERKQRDDINEWRNELGLGPMYGSFYRRLEQQRIPILHAYSPSLVPAPNDWGGHNRIAGAIQFADKHLQDRGDRQWPQDFSRWLEEGSAPIYFGFGSMPVSEPRRMIRMVLEINKRLRTRAVVVSGWSAMSSADEALPESIYMIRSADHRRLFPRCSCIVHHGGAGTTHAALESGIPTVICSIFADQPFWAERIREHGIGRHIPYRKLTTARLAKAIRELQSPSVRAKAAEMGNRIRQENGLQEAVAWIGQQLPTAPVFRNR